ncbi:heavy metal-binding domain-containing protein [Sphingobacterium multivorum]|uniref:heavy metal-binding domain-containing protein n=1 Tax=Sphingobacterium multivorum TaxID=28454 RepID=UPI00345E4E74
MIVTATNSIEGREISQYNDPIVTNVVIGTNIFSDIEASYVDVFGGRSTIYEKKMQEIYECVTETLKQRIVRIDLCRRYFLIDINGVSKKKGKIYVFKFNPIG